VFNLVWRASMAHWVLYALFSVGVVIELVSVYLDWRVMTGRGKTSGAWGVAFVIFVLFGLYGALLGNRRGEPFVFTRELAVALAAIGFQIVFHALYPWARIYWLKRDS
jgi:hypothetical protein